MDAVVHMASPLPSQAEDPNELIVPAVQGTTNILLSASKHSTIKRLVYTSSTAAILSVVPKPRVWSEEDWNTTSLKEVEEKGKDASPIDKYRASKVLAERTAWDFVKAKGADISWDLVTINPPFVFGPVIHEVHGPESLGSSMREWWLAVSGKKSDDELANVG